LERRFRARVSTLLVVGSSLMVYSGFRFCRLAVEHGIPIVAINPGRTRADDLLALKVPARFEDLLASLNGRLRCSSVGTL
jgi:NAD-dependent SIR2 family protein deacetylase